MSVQLWELKYEMFFKPIQGYYKTCYMKYL